MISVPRSSRWNRALAPVCRGSMCKSAARAAKSLDDKPWFAHLNTSKRSLALDMKKPESRELIDPLLDVGGCRRREFFSGHDAQARA